MKLNNRKFNKAVVIENTDKNLFIDADTDCDMDVDFDFDNMVKGTEIKISSLIVEQGTPIVVTKVLDEQNVIVEKWIAGETAPRDKALMTFDYDMVFAILREANFISVEEKAAADINSCNTFIPDKETLELMSLLSIE